MFNEGVEYPFETIAESTKWINEHYPNGGGLYGLPRWGVGISREGHELYLKSFELHKSVQDLYDEKYGIQRYEI
jgi:hypothetical protein